VERFESGSMGDRASGAMDGARAYYSLGVAELWLVWTAKLASALLSYGCRPGCDNGRYTGVCGAVGWRCRRPPSIWRLVGCDGAGAYPGSVRDGAEMYSLQVAAFVGAPRSRVATDLASINALSDLEGYHGEQRGFRRDRIAKVSPSQL
jgi:hypothetical protein